MSGTNNALPKAKNIMYTQDVDHASFNTTKELEARISKLAPQRFAIAFHDHDTDDKGKPVREHWHAMMSFKNARSLNAISKGLGESSAQFCQAWRGDSRNGYAYLVHRTDNSRNKYQYDPNTIVANFDYPKALEEMEAGATAGKTTAKIDVLLNALYEGHLTREELKEQLTGAQIGAHNRKINDVWHARLEREAKDWRETMLAENRHSETIWLTGETETGKTTMARALCEKRGKGDGYYISGSTKDPFQNYAGEHYIILDELSPKIIDFADLKRITDPFAVGYNLQAPMRYRDGILMPELLVVTSAFDPYQLYRGQVSSQEIDSFKQLLRRISVVLRLTQDEIIPLCFNSKDSRFEEMTDNVARNPYSLKANKNSASFTSTDAFNNLIEELDLAHGE